MVFKIMKNKSVRTEIQKSFLWNFKLYAFIGCLAFPLNVLGESVSFDTDNVAFMSPSQRIKVTGIVKDEAGITLPGVNVVVKVNDLDIFLDTLKKNNYEMVEDYAVVLKENVKYLLEEDKSLAINNAPLFTIPVDFMNKTFKLSPDDSDFNGQDSYTSLTLEVEDFIKFIEG